MISRFKNKKFTVTYTIDKRSKPINQTTIKNLRKYYDLSSSEEDVSNENISVLSVIKKIKKEEKQKIRKWRKRTY